MPSDPGSFGRHLETSIDDEHLIKTLVDLVKTSVVPRGFADEMPLFEFIAELTYAMGCLNDGHRNLCLDGCVFRDLTIDILFRLDYVSKTPEQCLYLLALLLERLMQFALQPAKQGHLRNRARSRPGLEPGDTPTMTK